MTSLPVGNPARLAWLSFSLAGSLVRFFPLRKFYAAF
jgi:hypothetical protein